MASHHPIRKTVEPAPSVIPDKLYFRIGDVARLCEVPAYVLRFWETEFPNLKPNKGGTGQRLYRKRDVETALRIKHLLYDLGYTIPGARQVFKTDARPTTDATLHAASVETPVALQSEARSENNAASLSEARGENKAVVLSEASQPHRQAQSKNPETVGTTHTAAQLSTPILLALRDELRALHTQLSSPITDAPTPKPLRPRLVLETKPRPEIKLGPVPLPGQHSLFPTE